MRSAPLQHCAMHRYSPCDHSEPLVRFDFESGIRFLANEPKRGAHDPRANEHNPWMRGGLLVNVKQMRQGHRDGTGGLRLSQKDARHSSLVRKIAMKPVVAEPKQNLSLIKFLFRFSSVLLYDQ